MIAIFAIDTCISPVQCARKHRFRCANRGWATHCYATVTMRFSMVLLGFGIGYAGGMTAALKLDAFLPYRLSITSNRVSGAIATSYQALFGLRIPEWRLVAVLAEGGVMSQLALGRTTRMDKVTVSRAAIALTARGLVLKRQNPDDQRSQLLELSSEGRALYAQVAPKALEMERRMFASFSDAERAQLLSMLDRLERAAAEFAPEQA